MKIFIFVIMNPKSDRILVEIFSSFSVQKPRALFEEIIRS